ncbi:MAG: hypothetical protein HY791_36765 [Deltaproteobacteria bacterium]|nr:hypothetical protein [Deltaproteobacteria bacterium]
MTENQGCVAWAVWLTDELEDPPVVLIRGGGGTEIESNKFTEFVEPMAIHKILFWDRENRANGAITLPQAAIFLERWGPALPADWHWPKKSVFVRSDSLLAEINFDESEKASLWLAGHDAAAIDEVEALLGRYGPLGFEWRS